MDIELAQALAENEQLRKEVFSLKADIADLKKECEYQRNGWLNACTTSTLQIEKLNEAKSIIRDFLNRSDKTAERAEKFLSEVEK